MDDLLKRHNGNNGDLAREGLDGGEGLGVDGLQPKQGQGDVGSGLELERSLEQVAAREAWLNEQSQLPVENWLTGAEGTDLTALDGVQQSQGEETTNPPRALLVIDARSNQWDPLSTHLPENTDLLLIDENQSGLEQVESSVRFAQSNGIAYEAVALVASRSTTGEVCLGSDSFAEDEVGLGTQQLNQLETDVLGEARLRLFADSITPASVETQLAPSSNPAKAVPTTVGAIANELLIPARLTLRTAQANGTVETAISTSFDENNQVAAASRLKKFLDGKAQPKIQWASFEQKQIQGAFVASTNTILISESLKGSSEKVQAVVLEEIGHWLEADLGVDSAGDEGEIFSKMLSEKENTQDKTQEKPLLPSMGKPISQSFHPTAVSQKLIIIQAALTSKPTTQEIRL